MALKGKGPNDFIPQQERFPTTGDGLMTNTKPTDHNVDYPTVDTFEQPQPSPGHDVFMYPSRTKGKKE